MKLLRGAISLGLSWILCFPAPLALAQDAPSGGPSSARSTRTAAVANEPSASPHHRTSHVSTELQGDARILHALNRFTFGPRPGDLDAVKAMSSGNTGLEKWFDRQLHPQSIDETDLNARLAEFPAMQWSIRDLTFRMPSPAMIRQAADGKIEVPQNSTLHAVYENQIYRYEMKRAAKAQGQPGTHAAQQARGAAGQQESARRSPVPESEGPVAPANGGAGPGINPNTTPNTSSNMDASIGSSPSMAAQSDAGQKAMAPQPATPANGASTPETSMAPNSMAPAAGPTLVQVDAVRPQADEALISSILGLQPEDRVRRLQAMQPADFESFIKSLKPVQRAALVAGMTPDLKESVEDLAAPEQTVVRELFAERLLRDIDSNAQLQEVMTDFWLNHFNIYLRKNEQMPYYLVGYARDTIRPHALGKFEDLLEAVAHSPAMLIYLDNAQSIGPDSMGAYRAKMVNERRPNAKRQAPEGLNENYARELMELHTVGVNGGYTQADVTQVARVLTGWTVDRPQFGGEFQFNENRHEPGAKKVMGTKIKENGEMEGRELLHMLAMEPATAQLISRQLAIRFVSDDPPQMLVDRMAKSYLASGGDIPTVLKTLFHSPEFWAADGDNDKVKTPLEFVVSAVRASNAAVTNFEPLVNALRQMGMPLYGCVPPVGYKWDQADWVSTGALVDRMNFALALAANRFPGITVEWAPEMDMSALDDNAPAMQVAPTPESEETRLAQVLLPGGVSDATRSAALKEFEVQSGVTIAPDLAARFSQVSRARPGAPNRAPADAYEREDQLLAGLLLGSPEFQRR
ncbi:MAG TPA: DUF1800 family protein [Terracidiphilus sp.]|jgi:uncharacterized protein (DUF1800 family)